MEYCRCDGLPMNGSDHCQFCYCEQYEERCKVPDFPAPPMLSLSQQGYCSCCGMSDYRTPGGGCLFCDGRRVCCLQN